MSLSTWARVRCACSGWLEITVNRDGYAVECCTGCHARRSLRGNPPAEEEPRKRNQPIPDDPRRPMCVVLGCERRAATTRTDMCSAHCGERRKAKNRISARECSKRKYQRRRLATRAPTGIQGQAYVAKRRGAA